MTLGLTLFQALFEGHLFSSIELVGSMGRDDVRSEIYVPTLIIITFQLLFPGNSGQAVCYAPGGHRVDVLYEPNLLPSTLD